MARQKATHVDSPKAVGERIRAARAKEGLSQRELASPGCSPAYLSRIEAGERTPSLQLLRELGRRLGVTADYLAVGEIAAPVERVTEAEVALALGEREQARQGFSELLESPDPVERARALTGLAAVLLDEGAVSDASELLDEAIAILGESIADFPRTVEVYVRACITQGAYESAAALLLRIRADLPSDDPRGVQYGVLLAN